MYIFLFIGFILLIKGADFFVEGSSSIAKLLRVPSVVIGLTVVAMGTSAPEMAVSVTAAISGKNAIALSNVLGSNLFNLLIVAGACAVVIPLMVNREIIRRDLPFSAGLTALLLLLCLWDKQVSHFDGCLLFGMQIGYLVYLIRKAMTQKNSKDRPNEPNSRRSPAVSILLIMPAGLPGISV